MDTRRQHEVSAECTVAAASCLPGQVSYGRLIALRQALDSMFLGLTRAAARSEPDVAAAAARVFAEVEDALTPLAFACRHALVALLELRDASLGDEVRALSQVLGALEDLFLDAAEEAANRSERTVQRELLKRILAARTEGTRIGAVASGARPSIPDGFGEALKIAACL